MIRFKVLSFTKAHHYEAGLITKCNSKLKDSKQNITFYFTWFSNPYLLTYMYLENSYLNKIFL